MIDDWRPTCAIDILRLRAQVFNGIRCFFLAKDVLEVETPLLGHACGTDPQLDFFTTDYIAHSQRDTLFLQTSPEFAMKRLLAAGVDLFTRSVKLSEMVSQGAFITLNLLC